MAILNHNKGTRMNNSIMTLRPYKYAGIWVFDDPVTGLVREAFVSGADKIIDLMTASIPNAENGMCLTFSADPFPEYQTVLNRLYPEFGGTWYHSVEYDVDGWLCGALFLYFDTAPEKIYARCQSV